MDTPDAVPRRVLLVEDDPFAGQAFAEFLTDLRYTAVLVPSYDRALETFDADPKGWALLVIDMLLRRPSARRGTGPELGIDLIRYVKTRTPKTPILVWTAYPSLLQAIVPLLADGVTGLVSLPKGSTAELVQQAIRQAESGAISIRYTPDDEPPHVAEQLLQALPQPVMPLVRRLAAQIDELAKREREVLGMLHLETEQIAQELGLTPKTVRNYLDNMYTRLNLKDEALPIRRDTLLVLAYLVYQLR